MKKKLIIAVSFVAVIIVCAHFILPEFLLKKITDYEPYTFERVLSNSELRIEYGIFGNNNPQDYGYKSEEINFSSIDGTNLNGWYIQAEKTTSKCLILLHGRTSNRLKAMKYLAMIDSLKLDSLYNVFIPDLRNSGKSQSAKTYMGYKFGEDVAASILIMKERFKQNTFLLYGFSMGAMGIFNAIHRTELKALYQPNIIIEKIIIDSPLVNVKETLRDQTNNVSFANFFFKNMYKSYSEEINGFGDNMNLSQLYDPDIPMLILQGNNDKTTKPKYLERELHRISNHKNMEVHYFEGPGHVKLFQDERTKMRYISIVGNFVKNKSS